jgi:hypothetical protein
VRGIWRNSKGQRRYFATSWNAIERHWECMTYGYGMKPTHWTESSQTMATSRLMMLTSWLWKWKRLHWETDLWSDRPDSGFAVPGAPP